MNLVLFQIGAFFYLLATLTYMGYLFALKDTLAKAAGAVLSLGFVFHTLALAARYWEAGHTPVTNLHESLSFFGWMIVGVLLVANGKYQIKMLGSFVSPLALIFMLFALRLPAAVVAPAPALQSYWHPFHVFFAFLGNALFALAFCCALMYLIQERLLKTQSAGAVTRRLPSLKILDDLNYQALIFGFPLLTLGIITGAMWAEFAWGRYWGWDPKETWSLITWLLYAALLHQRLAIGWRGRKAAWMAIAGFMAVLFTFLGVNWLPGLHGYLN